MELIDQKISEIKKKEEEVSKELIEAASNPVAFGKYFFNFECRDWQKEFLLDTSLKKVVRVTRGGGKSIAAALYCLWFAAVNRDKVVLIVAPSQNHTKVVFDHILKFISNSKEIEEAIERKMENPRYILFKNESVITGYTLGTKSGSKGFSARGRHPDLIYIDESDYASDEDLDTIFPLLTVKPKVYIIMSSTPTGKRSRFYEACVHKELGWKEFHFNAWQAIPGWNEERDRQARINCRTENVYITEIEASWGVPMEKVFNRDLLKLSYTDYKYVPVHHDISFKKTMGVDWDKYSAGPQLLVMVYDHTIEKFRILARKEIPKSKYRLMDAVREVIEFAARYDPNYIYVDRGFAEANVELLQEYGERHPETKLLEKVKGISYSENIIVRDAFGYPREVNCKQFGVNYLVSLFERQMIQIPLDDLNLRRQLEDYEVVRISDHSGPVYTRYNEHIIDAFILAALAFHQEFVDVTKKVNLVTEPTFIGFNQEKVRDDFLKTSVPIFIPHDKAFLKKKADRPKELNRKMF